MGSQRVLFLSTRGRWTCCFDNGAKGGNPFTIVGELSQQMHCRGISCGCIPNTLTRGDKGKPGTWGAVKFTLFAPDKRDFLNVDRSVSVINDIGGWEFNTVGSVQDFEQVERYKANRIVDRFTPEMLEDYCRALDISLFDANFYGGAGVLTHVSPWFFSKLPTTTLADARKQLGFSD